MAHRCWKWVDAFVHAHVGGEIFFLLTMAKICSKIPYTHVNGYIHCIDLGKIQK